MEVSGAVQKSIETFSESLRAAFGLQRVANCRERVAILQLAQRPRCFEPDIGVFVTEQPQQTGWGVSSLFIEVADGPRRRRVFTNFKR